MVNKYKLVVGSILLHKNGHPLIITKVEGKDIDVKSLSLGKASYKGVNLEDLNLEIDFGYLQVYPPETLKNIELLYC